MKLIGFAGLKGSGKDTAADVIIHLTKKDCIKLAFASFLKNEVAKALNIPREALDKYKDLYRPILQWWGTDWRRANYGEDYWIKKWVKSIETIEAQNPPNYILVPDVRFPNEVEAIKSRGGIVIYVTGVGKDYKFDMHQSENSINGKGCDEIIINDFNDSHYIVENMDKIIKKYKL